MTDPGWFDLPDEDGFKGGGRVPLQLDQWHEAKMMKRPDPTQINKLNRDRSDTRGNPKDEGKFSNHSWRSDFKRVNRAAKLDHVLQEALHTHGLKQLEKTYGGDAFPDQRLLDGAEKVWKEVDQITGVLLFNFSSIRGKAWSSFNLLGISVSSPISLTIA